MNNTAEHRPSLIMRVVALLGAALLAGAMLSVVGASAPAEAASVSQCSNERNDTGEGVACDITIENFLNLATGAMHSTVILEKCTGFYDALNTCDTPVVLDLPTELTTSATQCNTAGNGPGGQVICSITVVNHIIGDATAAVLPINQCVGSAGGGGTARVCNPDPASADASEDGVTQCNGSADGGGGSMTCSVMDPDSMSGVALSNSAFEFLANQCNGSARGGGAEMICSVNVSTVIEPVDEEGDGDGSEGEGEGSGGEGSDGEGSGGSEGEGSGGSGTGGEGSEGPGGEGSGGQGSEGEVDSEFAALDDDLAATGASDVGVMLGSASAVLLLFGAALAVVATRRRSAA